MRNRIFKIRLKFKLEMQNRALYYKTKIINI